MITSYFEIFALTYSALALIALFGFVLWMFNRNYQLAIQSEEANQRSRELHAKVEAHFESLARQNQ